MSRGSRKLCALLMVGLMSAPPSTLQVLAAGDEATQPVAVTRDMPSTPLDAAGAGARAAAERLTKDNAVYVVRLQDNGSLLGNLKVQYPTGKSIPADGKIVLLRDGKKVDWSRTDADGGFRLEGLQPGSYVAQATIETGTTDFNVRVRPFDAAAQDTEMSLTATLTPTPEVIYDQGFVDEQMLLADCGGCGTCDLCAPPMVEECVEPVPCDIGCAVPPPCGGGFSGGGCCGGGGFGWGGLLGAAGLATGITALATNDDHDHQPPASPASP